MKHMCTAPPATELFPESLPTFADLIVLIQASKDLSDCRRRDMMSGLRRVASALQRELTDIPASPRWLQPRIAAVMPVALGVTGKTWRTAVSNARSALAHAGIVTRQGRHRNELSAAWGDLWEAALKSKDKSLTVGLGRFVHYLSERGLNPGDVAQGEAEAFYEFIMGNELSKQPEKVWQNAVWGWNLARERIPGWPQARLSPPDRKNVIRLSDDELPVAFVEDLSQLMQRLASPDIFDEDGPNRALRPATIKQQTGMLKRFASELLRGGLSECEINSVAALCDPIHAERGLRAMVEHIGGTNTVIADMSVLLCSTARRLNLRAETSKALAKMASRLKRPEQRGLTKKNRDRLRPLQNPDTLRRLLEVPEQLLKASAKMTPKNAALAREDALAIAILLVCPLRIKNLGELNLERDVQRPGYDQVFISIAEEQVKNGQPIEFELPPDVRKLLDKHLASRSPLLCPHGCPWLFPRRDGAGPVDLPAFSTRLSKRIREVAGLKVNPHLFRHLIAMVWLTANPGAYEATRRLLSHTSTRTTISSYTGLETTGAIRALGEVLTEKRKKG